MAIVIEIKTKTNKFQQTTQPLPHGACKECINPLPNVWYILFSGHVLFIYRTVHSSATFKSLNNNIQLLAPTAHAHTHLQSSFCVTVLPLGEKIRSKQCPNSPSLPSTIFFEHTLPESLKYSFKCFASSQQTNFSMCFSDFLRKSFKNCSSLVKHDEI